tara:strand:+ start:166 stop:804 length:639 start_codon:yes stop_codon:yes gene_type:complete
MNIQLKHIIPDALNESLSPYGEIWGRDIQVSSGEFIHVLAPSGAGKSTLMGIMYGTRKDYEGDLLINNHKIHGAKSWSDFRTNELAIVFQDLELLNDLTVLENIQLKNQLTNHFTEVEIFKMLVGLSLDKCKNKRVGLLSRGEKQRVAIIRSLCMPFSWLFLDEPFSALDDENTQKALSVIKEQVNSNKSGVIMANLHKDSWFNYSRTFKMA